MNFTSHDIETILKSPCGKRNPHLSVKTKRKIVKARNDCPQVVKMHWDIKYWAEEKGIEFEKEYKFSKRKYRFDFAIITDSVKIGIEYHGLTKEKSGHTTTKGFTNDTEKMNLANTEGWKVLAYTFSTYQNVLQDLERLIA